MNNIGPTLATVWRIATAYIALAAYQLYLNQRLQIRWRNWLSRHSLGKHRRSDGLA